MVHLEEVDFFFNDTATTEIYTLSLHDALPIFLPADRTGSGSSRTPPACPPTAHRSRSATFRRQAPAPCRRSEEHTSELQSRQYLVCRLLLEKKNSQLSASLSHPYLRYYVS